MLTTGTALSDARACPRCRASLRPLALSRAEAPRIARRAQQRWLFVGVYGAATPLETLWRGLLDQLADQQRRAQSAPPRWDG